MHIWVAGPTVLKIAFILMTDKTFHKIAKWYQQRFWMTFLSILNKGWYKNFTKTVWSLSDIISGTIGDLQAYHTECVVSVGRSNVTNQQ